DVAAIFGANIEPAEQRLAESRVGDRCTLLPERPFFIEAQADGPHLLDHLGRQFHRGTVDQTPRRAMRSLVKSFCFFSRAISSRSVGVSALRFWSCCTCSSRRRCSAVSSASMSSCF